MNAIYTCLYNIQTLYLFNLIFFINVLKLNVRNFAAYGPRRGSDGDQYTIPKEEIKAFQHDYFSSKFFETKTTDCLATNLATENDIDLHSKLHCLIPN